MEIDMNQYVIRQGMLTLCLWAGASLALADSHHMMDHDDGAHHQGQGRFGPVERAEKHLGELEKKLNLQPAQMSTWNTYSQAMMGHAKHRAQRMEQFRARRGTAREEADTATKLERLSQWMREGADRLDQMAKDTRAFQNVLTAEQQTIFDLYWKAHSPRGRQGRHRGR
jgi:hypothetical protein